MDRLLSRDEVEQAIGLKRSQLYTLMRKGIFPEPIRIGERAVRWRESDLQAYVDSRPIARGWPHDDAPQEPRTAALSK